MDRPLLRIKNAQKFHVIESGNRLRDVHMGLDSSGGKKHEVNTDSRRD